jgi:hypothetical protein
VASQRLWNYARECARRDGQCFVHNRGDDEPPEFALMTIERYRALAEPDLDNADAAIGDRGWDYEHASHEVVNFVAECDMY